MGISDWFKRFKRNAAAFEEYREGVEEADEAQADRAAHEGMRAPLQSATAKDKPRREDA